MKKTVAGMSSNGLGDIRAARIRFVVDLMRSREDSNAWFKLGRSLAKEAGPVKIEELGEVHTAQSCFVQALKHVRKNQDIVLIWLNLASTLKAGVDPGPVKVEGLEGLHTRQSCCVEVLKYDREDFMAWFGLGTTLKVGADPVRIDGLDQFHTARSCYEKSLQINDSKDNVAWTRLLGCLKKGDLVRKSDGTMVQVTSSMCKSKHWKAVDEDNVPSKSKKTNGGKYALFPIIDLTVSTL